MEKKKKAANYIIPATFFQALSPAKRVIQQPIPAPKIVAAVPEIVIETPKPKLVKPVLQNVQRRSSSLSLKSVHEKKVVHKSAVEENFDNHPKEAFNEAKLQKLWKEYVALLNQKGERSMASIVATDVPKLEAGFKINFTVPNKLMQDQFKRGRPKLLNFLREKLNNYGITIDAILNETVEKKFAYTPLEKYNKLKEKNPLLAKLRQVFELDM